MLCRKMGHVAANGPAKRTPAIEESPAVQQMPRDRYFKRVFICEREVNALIDTESNLCLMRRDQYDDLGSRAPVLRDSNVHFRGIGEVLPYVYFDKSDARPATRQFFAKI